MSSEMQIAMSGQYTNLQFAIRVPIGGKNYGAARKAPKL